MNALRYAWAVLTGRLVLPAQIEGIVLMAELAKTTAALAALSSSADRLIAKAASDAAALVDAVQTIATVDDATAAQIADVTAKIDAAAPAPVEQPVDEQPAG